MSVSLSRRAALAALAGSMAGCGYHVSGHADLMPSHIRTIAIPAFVNVTTRYRLTDMLPEAIAREFITRTRYRVVSKPEEADAVLTGGVSNVQAFSTVFDPRFGRAASMQINVVLQLRLTERSTGKVLYNQPAMEYRQRYEVSARNEVANDPVTQNVYFDESTEALQRLSREVAQKVVSGVLEAF